MSRRIPLAAGGLGAALVLGLGAQRALGREQDHTDQVRAALYGGRAGNVIMFLGDGMGT
jgi:alkaline phosphatase